MMLREMRFAILVGLVFLGSVISNGEPAPSAASGCAVVEDALRASIALKPGMTRADVERTFEAAGGLNFRSKTYYEFKECRYLHIEVEFTVDSKAENLLAPTDTIESVSKMYVEYQAKD